jgi:hypothetical protein
MTRFRVTNSLNYMYKRKRVFLVRWAGHPTSCAFILSERKCEHNIQFSQVMEVQQ